ncbi:MAG: creatininase family protein [bacterium]|nr:creatininase family protein [bacterium]
MQLKNLTTYDVQKYLERKKTIVLPFGSTEQHGPHLPIGTDAFVAEAIANEAGSRSQTIVAPVAPLGFSPGLHSHFAGTISLRATTYIQLIQDILGSLVKTGFEDFLLLTGHGMNHSPLKTALFDFLNTHNARALLMGYWELDELQLLLEAGDGSHCTILETSIMLYLKPELVDMSKALDEYKQARFLLGSEQIKEISNSGIIAETTKATAEKGKQYFDASVAGMLRVLQSFESEQLYD